MTASTPARAHRAALLSLILAVGQVGPASAIQETAAPTAGFRAEMTLELARFRERILEFVAEIPEDKLTWKVNEEAPSLAEVTARIAATGFRTLQSLERENDVNLEELTRHEERAALLADLEAMTEAALRALAEIPDEALEAPIDHLGRRWSVRGIFLLLDSQLHEGLGRLAGFAEAGGIDPPWVRRKKAEALTDD